MKLNNYLLDGHALAILNKKIDEQYQEILILRERIRELEKNKYNFSFSDYPEIINIEDNRKILSIIATVGIKKDENSPGHHVIAEYKSDKKITYSYHVSEDILNIVTDEYLKSVLINLHKQLINNILDTNRKKND